MSLPRLSALAALLLATACGGEQRPNIVLITMDTTRADYLSAYGYAKETTPNLDGLAAEGTRFDLAMSTAAVTPVSHSAILSGRFNRDHGVRVIFAGSGFRLPDDVPTLATEAKRAGYETIAVHSAFPVSPYFGLTRGFDVVKSFDAKMNEEADGKGTWDQHNTRRSDETTDLVLQALAAREDHDAPFLLWIHYWDPHDSMQLPPKEFYPPPVELFEFENGKVKLDAAGNPIPKHPMTAMYAAEIHYMDSQIGRVFDYLREQGLWDDTLIAVTADHGQGLGDHGWAAHRILYQEQIHVPLIVRIPGVHQVASVSDLVRTVDIEPTLLDYAGIPIPDRTSGRTLRPLIEGAADTPRMAFAEQINLFDSNAHMVAKRSQDDLVYCAMDVDWKLIWRPNHPDQSELFHISADPHEQVNLFRRDHPEAIRLGKELGKESPWVLEPFPHVAGGADEAGATERLRELGYIDAEDVENAEAADGVPPTEGETGAGTEIAWDWICPDPAHADQRSQEQGRCAICGAAKILIARGK